MSRFLFSLVLMGICNNPISTAHADEPALSVVAPASSGTPPINRRGLRNKPAVVVGYDTKTGCPVAYTNGPQYMQAGDAAVFATAADARARCIEAQAEAETRVIAANARATREILLADSASQAVVIAATGSEPVLVNGMASTGTASNISAGGYGTGGWTGRGAVLVSAFNAVNNGGGYGAPPPVVQQRSISDDTVTVPEEVEPAEPELTPEQQLAEAEARAREAMRRAGIK